MRELLCDILLVLVVLLLMVAGVAMVMLMLRAIWWLGEGILMGGWF